MKNKLTGKCREKFIFWMCKNNEYVRWHEYETMPECALNALIIEFFDSVGIYISVVREFECFESYVNSKCVSVYSESRTEATNASIEKANVIYNEYKL